MVKKTGHSWQNFGYVLITFIVCHDLSQGPEGGGSPPGGVSASAVSTLPETFGRGAWQFRPLPGTVIAAHCTWKVKLDTVYNRIPQTITEIICQNPNGGCGGNNNYNCRQIRSRMLVGYEENGIIVNMRNRTVSIGCSCIRRSGIVLNNFRSPIIEKRGQTTSLAAQRMGVSTFDDSIN